MNYWKASRICLTEQSTNIKFMCYNSSAQKSGGKNKLPTILSCIQIQEEQSILFESISMSGILVLYTLIWIQSATLLKVGNNKPQHLISTLHFHSFLTRFRAALAELDRSAWENMMKTCMTPVTSAIPAAVNATPLHVDRSCVHLKNLMAPNNRRNDQNRVTCSISRNRKSAARQHINTFKMHIRQDEFIELCNGQQFSYLSTKEELPAAMQQLPEVSQGSTHNKT